MQENNFEKKVQQKTDELKLNPSEEVWQRVAEAVAKKTNDRRIFAIILMLLVFISSATLIIWDRTTGKKAPGYAFTNSKLIKEKNINKIQADITTHGVSGIATPANKQSKKNDDDRNENGTQNITLVKSKGDRHKPAPPQLSKKTTTAIVLNEPGDHNTMTLKQTGNESMSNSNKSTYYTKKKLTLAVSNGDRGEFENEKAALVDKRKLIVDLVNSVVNDMTAIRQVSNTVIKELTGSQKYITDIVSVGQKTIDKGALPGKKSSPSTQQIGWQIGVNFSLGVSATQNGYLGIIGWGNATGLKALDSNPNQSTGGNIGQGANYPLKPSKIKTGAGITVGAFVQKNISAKATVAIGLNYKAYNSSMTIGPRWDSVSTLNVNRVFYRTGNASSFKNYFHMIELPVTTGYKLSQQKKAPIYLNAGLAVARLIGSNALQFDTASGSYYKNNDLLNKVQVRVSLGLLFSLWHKSQHPLLIGPDINYGLTKMAVSGLYADRHYSYFGILVQKQIGKK